MRRGILVSGLTALLLLAGCAKEGPVSYSGFEMGSIRDGVITTDQQIRLTVLGNDLRYDLSTPRRVMVRYETLSREEASTYSINLQELWETSVLAPLPAEEPTGLVTDDPVMIDDAWFSGGYLNIGLLYEGKDPALHDFLLVYAAGDGRMDLRLFHDNRESVADPESRLIYLCFPLEEITDTFRKEVSPDAGPIPVRLQWRDASEEGLVTGKDGSYRP